MAMVSNKTDAFAFQKTTTIEKYGGSIIVGTAAVASCCCWPAATGQQLRSCSCDTSGKWTAVTASPYLWAHNTISLIFHIMGIC